MRILVNALSSTGMSGQHVVFGFLRQLLGWTDPADPAFADVDWPKATSGEPPHEFVLLTTEAIGVPDDLRRSHLEVVTAPAKTAHWLRRSLWESRHLPRLVEEHRIDVLLNPTGGLAPRVDVPQWVLAMNPWCLVPLAQRGLADRVKAAIQRSRYVAARRRAACVVSLSESLRSLYRDAAGTDTPDGLIAYVGIDDDVYDRAAVSDVSREDDLIVAVSAMARWKGAHDLVDAVAMLRDDGCDARLELIGPWPDGDYRDFVVDQIETLGLDDRVTLRGKLPREELLRRCATARVFALPSGCESFGIPAAEAQVFGTPTVAAHGCAIPEVCGEGGRYVRYGDVPAIAAELRTLLTDDAVWAAHSAAAKANSKSYRWSTCSQPWLSLLGGRMKTTATHEAAHPEPAGVAS